MKSIVFQVMSNTLKSMDIDDNTTVGKLRELLTAAGYDVREAQVKVSRPNRCDTLIGQVDSYVLSDADAVEFTTKRCDAHNVAKVIAKGVKIAVGECAKPSPCGACGVAVVAPTVTQPECKCAAPHAVDISVDGKVVATINIR